jgi:hypothetical protein
MEKKLRKTDAVALACMWLNDTNGGEIDRHTTFVPETFSDKPALWAQWRRDDAELLAKRGGDPLRLSELLAQQEARAAEATNLNERRYQYERKHMKVLDRTKDLTNGKLDDLLARARELTSNR